MLFFPTLLKNVDLPDALTIIHFPIKHDTEVENRSIISTTYRVPTKIQKKKHTSL